MICWLVALNPHFYCLPILKRQTHQQTLLEVATSANPKFFLGTDSAPPLKMPKKMHVDVQGCYSAPTAIELYAQAFDQVVNLNALKVLPATLVQTSTVYRAILQQLHLKEDQVIPESLDYLDGEQIIPLYAGKTIQWRKV